MSIRPATAARVGATISGTGLAVPSQILTNADLEKLVDTNDEWITKRTGIKERHISEEPLRTSDLAADALLRALDKAKLKPQDLDLVIVATMTPDMVCPATAAQVVAKIDAVPCGALDINVACTGFVAALNIAANFIASGMYAHIGVIGAEQLSRIVNWEDRNTCVLFGDGAGAAIVSATDDPNQGCLQQSMHSDGSKANELYVPRTEQDVPGQGAAFSGKFDTLQMNGREIYKFAVNTLQSSIHEALEECGLDLNDVKVIIPHQSNVRILESAREKLGLPEDKVYINLPRYGNTSAASVGICLHELMDAGRLQRGDLVVFIALGGGLTWATSVWKL
ncbi:ketoacyl-ACP synthase III [Planctomycetales bacterium ZRK34]|nr:ketoacyl-ACP synthase III [Planctomycetales bacterium ZRK34]